MAFEPLNIVKPTPSFQPLATKSPSLLDNVWNSTKSIASDMYGALTAPAQKQSFDMQGSLQSGWDTIVSTIKDTADRLNTPLPNISQPKDVQLTNAIGVGRGAMGLLNTAFLGITAPLKSAESIPGVGYVATAVNNVFSALGTGGSDIASNAIDALPVSDATKEKIRPLAQEIGALTAQIIAGKLGGDAVGTVKEKSKAMLDTLHSELSGAKAVLDTGPVKTIPVQGESPTQSVPFANKYETPSTIQMGTKTETLPVAARSPVDTTKAPAGYTYEPIKPTEAPVSPEMPITAPITAKVGEVAPASETPTVGGKTVTKVASDINTTLVKQGFDALPIEEQSKYTAQSYKEQAQHIASEMDTNIENVKAMATGDKHVPAKINGQILFNTVEAYATKVGDGELLTRLASSPLGKKLSEAGQTLGGHGFNDNPNSPVDAIRRVQESRQASMKTKGVDIAKETMKETVSIKSEVAKAVKESLPKWETFIQSITCGY